MYILYQNILTDSVYFYLVCECYIAVLVFFGGELKVYHCYYNEYKFIEMADLRSTSNRSFTCTCGRNYTGNLSKVETLERLHVSRCPSAVGKPYIDGGHINNPGKIKYDVFREEVKSHIARLGKDSFKE